MRFCGSEFRRSDTSSSGICSLISFSVMRSISSCTWFGPKITAPSRYKTWTEIQKTVRKRCKEKYNKTMHHFLCDFPPKICVCICKTKKSWYKYIGNWNTWESRSYEMSEWRKNIYLCPRTSLKCPVEDTFCFFMTSKGNLHDKNFLMSD